MLNSNPTIPPPHAGPSQCESRLCSDILTLPYCWPSSPRALSLRRPSILRLRPTSERGPGSPTCLICRRTSRVHGSTAKSSSWRSTRRAWMSHAWTGWVLVLRRVLYAKINLRFKRCGMETLSHVWDGVWFRGLQTLFFSVLYSSAVDVHRTGAIRNARRWFSSFPHLYFRFVKVQKEVRNQGKATINSSSVNKCIVPWLIERDHIITIQRTFYSSIYI